MRSSLPSARLILGSTDPVNTRPSLSDLLGLTHRAARGKRRSVDVAEFLLDPVPRLLRLQSELAQRTYQPGLPRGFVIHEPKRRVISALPFRDRIVQHYLIAHSLPALERWSAARACGCGCTRPSAACTAPPSR